ncbi:MAG: hypothetical protein ACQCN3_06320 [Candidatus Bathyarchaeia archaeon]
MTRIFSDGFESGLFDNWDSTAGSPEVQSTEKYAGNYAAHFTCHQSYAYAQKTIAATRLVYARAYFKFMQIPVSSNYAIWFLRATDGTFGAEAQIVWDVDRAKFALKSGYWGSTVKVDSIYPVVDTWYCVELKYAGTWSTPKSELWINGSKVAEINPEYNRDAAQIQVSRYANLGTGVDCHIYADCVVIDDNYIGLESGSTIQTVADAFQVSDAIFRYKSVLPVFDAVALEDQVMGNKSLFLTEQFSVEDQNSSASKVLLIDSDDTHVVDVVSVDKMLVVSEYVNAVETVESGVFGGKKTRLFLVLGDLAIQINGD